MEYRDRNVLVTGGIGALGTAVVAALIEGGATSRALAPRRRGAALRLSGPQTGQPYRSVHLTDEAAVGRLFGSIQALWASIHIAGGFAMAPVAKSHKAGVMKLLDTNLVSCFLCCSAAVNAIGGSGQGGRIVT